MANAYTSIDDNVVFVNLVSWAKNNAGMKIKNLEDDDYWYNEQSRQWWNKLTVKDDKLYTPDRQVKILHFAGGYGWGVNKRMSCSLFSDEVKQWLNKITGTTTFTDYDGKEFGEFLKSYYKL